MTFCEIVEQITADALEIGVKLHELREFLGGNDSATLTLIVNVGARGFTVKCAEIQAQSEYTETKVEPEDWQRILPKLTELLTESVEILHVFALKSNQVVTGQELMQRTGRRLYGYNIDNANKGLARLEPYLTVKRLDAPAPAGEFRMKFPGRRFQIVKLVPVAPEKR